MDIMTNEQPNFKISFIKLKQLQKEFKFNYENLAREYFNKLDNDTQLILLNNEFQFDKDLIVEKNNKTKSLTKCISQKYTSYLYTTSFSMLDTNLQGHIRHNVYRTISAMLLNDCSFEEKTILLSKSTNLSHYKSPSALQIATNRLTTLIDCLNEYNASIGLTK
ncbi:MAG: hypothetical protein IJ458_01075 [Clostridia bacterium]|nr:hypothetical protein [Clostridia bacterium]